QERVRRRLEPDQVDAVGRRPGLVELDALEAPAAELLAHDHAGAEVAAFGERDLPSGLEQCEQQRRRRRRARREEERLAVRRTLERRELPLRRDARRMVVAGV